MTNRTDSRQKKADSRKTMTELYFEGKKLIEAWETKHNIKIIVHEAYEDNCSICYEDGKAIALYIGKFFLYTPKELKNRLQKAYNDICLYDLLLKNFEYSQQNSAPERNN